MRAFCFGGLWHLKLEHPILQCGGGFRRNHLGWQIDHAHGGYVALWFNDVIEITGLRAENILVVENNTQERGVRPL